MTSRESHFTENEFTTSSQILQDSNDLFNRTTGTFFNVQNDTNLPIDNQVPDLGVPWSIAQFSSAGQKGDDAMTGMEVGQEKPESTLILENVQPQMVTKIINMLYK